MLLVDTYLDKSAINGIGLFARQFILKNTNVWVFDSRIDQIFTEEQISALSPFCSKQIQKYAYPDKNSREIILCGDDARFFNHSRNSNCIDTLLTTVAVRDIIFGEELTIDYKSFFYNWDAIDFSP